MARLRDKYFDQGGHYCFSSHVVLSQELGIVRILEGFEDTAEFARGIVFRLDSVSPRRTSIMISGYKVFRHECVEVSKEVFDGAPKKYLVRQ